MNKVLFGTTALVAAAFAGAASAGDVSLGLGGYLNAGVAFGDYVPFDGEPESDFQIIRDGEIHFKGKGTLDNGLTIETRVELEAYTTTACEDVVVVTDTAATTVSVIGSVTTGSDTQATASRSVIGSYAETTDTITANCSDDQIDENWVKISSSFGTIQIGSDDSAFAHTKVGGTYFGPGGNFGSFDPTYVFSGAEVSGTFFGSDNLAVHYYTPNIAGFEATISYAPDTSSDGVNDGTYSQTDNGDNLLTVGATYSNTFGDVDFTVGAGYGYQELEGEDDESTAWHAGASVGFSGFTVNGIYETGEESNDDERTLYGVGATYATGPWDFGVSYAAENDEPATGDDTDIQNIAAGFGYQLGDGVAVGAEVDWGTVDDGSDEEDGFGGALLLGVDF